MCQGDIVSGRYLCTFNPYFCRPRCHSLPRRPHTNLLPADPSRRCCPVPHPTPPTASPSLDHRHCPASLGFDSRLSLAHVLVNVSMDHHPFSPLLPPTFLHIHQIFLQMISFCPLPTIATPFPPLPASFFSCTRPHAHPRHPSLSPSLSLPLVSYPVFPSLSFHCTHPFTSLVLSTSSSLVPVFPLTLTSNPRPSRPRRHSLPSTSASTSSRQRRHDDRRAFPPVPLPLPPTSLDSAPLLHLP